MNTRRIALLCQHFYPEMVSTGMHMTELMTRLAELGWDVTVFCARPSWGDAAEQANYPRTETYQGVHICRVPTLGDQRRSLLSRGFFAATFLLSVWRQILGQRKSFPGLMVTTNPPFLGLVGWFFARFFRLPYLLLVYDVYPDIAVNLGILSRHSLFTKLWGWVTRLILQEAAVVVVIGRDMAEIIKQKMPVERHGRIQLIPNWSDERHVKPVARAENPFTVTHGLQNKFVVQYAGRMGRTHNLEPLLEAARMLQNEAICFQFVGQGAKKEQLEALAAEYKLQNVQFLPYQPMEVLTDMLSAADLAVVCLESHFTGLSVPSKSYGVMAGGTAILGFMDENSEIARVIREEGCGVVLPEPTGEQVAQAIRRLLQAPETLQAMAAAGRQAFVTKYTLGHAAQAYDVALQGMLNPLTAVTAPTTIQSPST